MHTTKSNLVLLTVLALSTSSLCSTQPASALLRTHLLPHSPSFARRQVTDPSGDIPPQCTVKCKVIVDALTDNSCVSNACFCSNTNTDALVRCLDCTIGLAPTEALVEKGQGVVDEYVSQCASTGNDVTPGKLDVPLSSSSPSPSSSATSTSNSFSMSTSPSPSASTAHSLSPSLSLPSASLSALPTSASATRSTKDRETSAPISITLLGPISTGVNTNTAATTSLASTSHTSTTSGASASPSGNAASTMASSVGEALAAVVAVLVAAVVV